MISMKRILALLLCLAALCGCTGVSTSAVTCDATQPPAETESIPTANPSDIPEEGFYYDPAVYPPLYTYLGARDVLWIITSVEQLEDLSRGIYADTSLIAICEVAGKSVNRIFEPIQQEDGSEWIPGTDNVVTPVRVLDVIYQGKDVKVEQEDIVNVVQSYFIVSEAAKKKRKDYYDDEYYPLNAAIITACDPLEPGRVYLTYLSLDNDTNSIYAYQGKEVYGVGREGVVCLNNHILSEDQAKDADYVNICKGAIEKYYLRYKEVMAARGK